MEPGFSTSRVAKATQQPQVTPYRQNPRVELVRFKSLSTRVEQSALLYLCLRPSANSRFYFTLLILAPTPLNLLSIFSYPRSM